MKTPYLVLCTNSQAARIVEDRATLERFAAAVSSQLADLLVVVGNTDADEGFIKGTLELAADLAFQLQQACAALRDGPERHQDFDWQAPPESVQRRSAKAVAA
ncbi:hypothetical protein RD110_07875 [Rhodoferax koreense]|uniref:Uncharacterized protein n=1 Tax=Rhodoferax koreensis TaxID=1842727 RepID=A0A1P8JTV0_9BURK|nr:hypothetical protein [Rhodoferax koreense]APW37121.1 hypothetical protein RD110_07875 [Rhodoferax koreense]